MTREQIEAEWVKWCLGRRETVMELLFMFAQHIAKLEREALIAEIDEWGNRVGGKLDIKEIVDKWRTK